MKIFYLNKINGYFLSVLLLVMSSSVAAKDFHSIGMCRASVDGLYTIYGGNTFDKLSAEATKTVDNNIALSKKLSPIFHDCLESHAKANPGSKSTGSAKSDGERIFSSCNKKINSNERNYLIGYFVGMNYIYKEIQKRSGFDFTSINLMCFAGRD